MSFNLFFKIINAEKIKYILIFLQVITGISIIGYFLSFTKVNLGNYLGATFMYIAQNNTSRNVTAQLAGTVEYTDCISAEG